MKELYYIRGSKVNPLDVRQKLLDKGGIDDLGLYFDGQGLLFYINTESKIRCACNMEVEKFILEYGIELKSVEPEQEENFEAFDKVIVKFRDKGYWTVDTFSHQKGKWFYCGGGISYSECHKYESWMEKYLGTNIPFEEFEKE